MSNNGLSADTKAGRLRLACLDLLREHERNIPTNGRFLFYELEQRGHIPKKYDGTNPKTGKPFARIPLQHVSDATMYLRERGLVPWQWIVDESRTLHEPRYAATVAEYLRDTIRLARTDVWGGEEAPLHICESRATAGVLTDLAYDYVTGGQSGGFIVNELVPILRGKRPCCISATMNCAARPIRSSRTPSATSRSMPGACSVPASGPRSR